MINHVISSASADSQSIREVDPLQNSASEGLKPGPDEDTQSLLKVMSRDIRSPLLSMLATLKLLNRGYYGNMDEEVGNQIRYLLSSATRLTGIVDACLAGTFAEEEEEIAVPNQVREPREGNTPVKQALREAKIEPLIL